MDSLELEIAFVSRCAVQARAHTLAHEETPGTSPEVLDLHV
jgi:hypothetical protein